MIRPLVRADDHGPRLDCELMNHLNVVIGFAGLLAESDRLDEPQRRYAAHIASSASLACASIRSFFKEQRAAGRRDAGAATIETDFP